MKLTSVTRKLSAAGLGLVAAISGGCEEQSAQIAAPVVQTTGGAASGAPGGPGVAPAAPGGSVAPAGGGEFGGLPAGGTEVATGGSPAPASDGEWCEALAVFRESCQTCHGNPIVGAPMSLVTYEDTQAISVLDNTTPLVQRIGERIHDAARPMPPVSQDPLSDAQKAAIDAWIAAGAPSAADATCGGEPEKPVVDGEFEWPADCEEFHTFKANAGSGPYMVPGNTELYQDFFFNVPWAGASQVQMLAYKPITDNSRVLHHWIMYEGITFLAGWAPGGNAAASADGVGMYMPTSGQLKMTTHYFNTGNPMAEPDASGVEICVTRKPREVTSTVFPFIAPASAPAGRRIEQVDTCTVRLKDKSQPAFLQSSSPHMHALGVHAKLEVLRVDGTTEVLHDKPFAFEDQKSYEYDEPIQLNDGDKVRTTCVFQNDTTKNVTFGEGSLEEMCFNFSGYYPACAMTCIPTGFAEQIIAGSQGGGCPTGLGGASGTGSGFGF